IVWGVQEVRTREALLPVGLAHRVLARRGIDELERHVQVAVRVLGAAEQAIAEFLVDRAAVPPRGRAVAVVEELVEAGDLRRLERLVGDERAFELAEAGGAQRRVLERRPRQRPHEPRLGIELMALLRRRVAAEEVAAAADGER